MALPNLHCRSPKQFLLSPHDFCFWWLSFSSRSPLLSYKLPWYLSQLHPWGKAINESEEGSRPKTIPFPQRCYLVSWDTPAFCVCLRFKPAAAVSSYTFWMVQQSSHQNIFLPRSHLTTFAKNFKPMLSHCRPPSQMTIIILNNVIKWKDGGKNCRCWFQMETCLFLEWYKNCLSSSRNISKVHQSFQEWNVFAGNEQIVLYKKWPVAVVTTEQT